MPILGIMASAMSANLWQPEGAYDSLATVTVGATAVSTITFTGIPSTYKHLQIRYIGRNSATGGTLATLRMRVNGYTSNYPLHKLQGDGASASAYGTTAEVYIQDNMLMSTNSAAASIYGAGVIDILDYANTNKFKTVRSLTGTDLNGSGQIVLGSGLYQQTTAISSITLEANAVNWLQYSSFALYGVK
jgi:hypothetical protein